MSGTVVVRRRRGWSWSRLMTAVLVASVVGMPGAPASAAGESVVCTGSAPSERVAAAIAKECDRRVQVDSQTSEYTRVVALPSGLMELEQTAVPLRVRRGDGWAPVDTTLEVLPDGRLTPRASTVDVRLSRGGRDDLATLSVGGGSVAVSWPGELPKPSLAGDTAVYAEVLPGVDLRVRATATGFTHVLVVKSAAAAADPALRSIRYGWSVRGLSTSSRADGGLDISNGSDVVLSVAPGAMWDSAAGSAHAKAGSDAIAPGEAAKIAPVDVALSEAELVVTPNLDLLTDPATVFPVYIDPPVSANRNRWGYSNSANQNRNDGVVRVGKSPDDGVVWRSYFEFALSGLASKFVYDARFYIDAVHTSDCASTPVSLYVTSGMDPGVNGTRTSAPSLGARVDEKWVQANATYPCYDPSPVGMEFGHDLFYYVREAAGQGMSPIITVGLVTNENEHRYWKKFNPSTARLTVWYNTHPSPPVPQDFSLASECYKACRSTVAASSSTTQAQGWWKLNETSGSTAADAATPPHPATAAGSYSWSDGGIAFTGGGDLYTNGPVVDTTKSFTVSAWAKLTNTNGFYTMVSQDGTTASAFWLRFDWGAQRWAFLRATEDKMYPALVSATAAVPVQLNTWVHVVGVYTNEPRETSITIYVNGARYETVWADPVFGATGPLVIGRAKWLGAFNDRFVGGIDNVQVYQRRLTDGDVTTLFQAGRSGGALNIAPAMLRTTTPELKIQVSDAEPDSQIRYGFEIYSAPSETAPVVYASGSGGPVRAPAVVGHRVAAGRLAPNTTYYWRARVEDDEPGSTVWSSFWSPFQALRVDADRPLWSSPPVVSPEYPERQYGLVRGSAGSFTFSAASNDVIEFEWWVDNEAVHRTAPASGSGPRKATVSYTPATPGKHLMHVKARDGVGLEVAYDYEFWVQAPPNVYAHWKLDEASGTTAVDSGNAPSYGGSLSPLSLSGSGVRFGAGYIDNGLVFTDNGAAAATGPVLDTTSAFTVMAWVNPSDLSADRTIVSQDGGGSSRFELHFDREANGGAGGWCVSMRAAETAAPVSACADGSLVGLPVTDAWLHVAAVFNPALTGQQLRIYVMGDPESCFPAETAAVEFAGDWSVTGAFVVGRARQAGADARFWRGGIDDVRAHQIALRGDEICRIAQP